MLIRDSLEWCVLILEQSFPPLALCEFQSIDYSLLCNSAIIDCLCDKWQLTTMLKKRLSYLVFMINLNFWSITYDIRAAVFAAEGRTLTHRCSIFTTIAITFGSSTCHVRLGRIWPCVVFALMVACSLSKILLLCFLWTWCMCLLVLARRGEAYWATALSMVVSSWIPWPSYCLGCVMHIALVLLDSCLSFHLLIMN